VLAPLFAALAFARTGALSAALALAGGGSFWMPPQGSSVAPGVDRIFYFIFWLSTFFFVLIIALAILFAIRYRRRAGYTPDAHPPTHSTRLEITWTAIPLALVFVIFYLGFKEFLNLTTPPANAYEIQVTAQQWKWTFTYPNGYVDENLHVPYDEPVMLVMTSEDVIHSLFVPDFRVKHDIVPGRYNKAWFCATEMGTHDLFCAEYCGRGHSDMLAKVIVHPPGEFEKWLANASNFMATLSPVEAGERLFRTRGCAQCHSVEGKAIVGPPLNTVFGSEVVLRGGGRVLADENYIRESVLDPQAKIVAGYDPVMPTYKGRLKDDEISALIAYLKSLAKPEKEP
jgi:cytochrome c oxidase subunit 2